MMNTRIKKILVFSHDAGSAELISAFIKKRGVKGFVSYVAGPARKIFKRKNLEARNLYGSGRTKIKNILLRYSRASYLLCGRSWASEMETRAIEEARHLGVKTIVYLDNWTNYKRSFGYPRRNWKNNLPDELWVGDKWAYVLAKKEFGRHPLRLVKNEHLEEIKREYKEVKAKFSGSADSILWVSEPLSKGINIFGDKEHLSFDEFYVFTAFLSVLSLKNFKKKIIIRMHPSEKENKYGKILAHYSGSLKIEVSRKRALPEDIVLAGKVIGVKSAVLVYALVCGKEVISFYPDKKFKCPLPFKEIKKITSAEALNKII